MSTGRVMLKLECFMISLKGLKLKNALKYNRLIADQYLLVKVELGRLWTLFHNGVSSFTNYHIRRFAQFLTYRYVLAQLLQGNTNNDAVLADEFDAVSVRQMLRKKNGKQKRNNKHNSYSYIYSKKWFEVVSKVSYS